MAMNRLFRCGLVGVALLWVFEAQAFCGFYVGKADAQLFNEASQVIMVRDGDRTVISMLNDYKGDLKDFALVVPVPEVLQRGQIHIGDKKIFDRLDAYSAPRLAEYFDENPCEQRRRMEMVMKSAPVPAAALADRETKTLGVTVEASYTVGEYDIVMLSAKESDGLEIWLLQNGYRIPKGAGAALKSYLRQDMKFFVAKVNLKEQAKTGFQALRPLQFAFESPRFMLPLRLGMVNAQGPQDLIVYALTRNGRVESSNYRTIKLPANQEIPVFVRSDFNAFYKNLFDQQARQEQYRAVFTEYFWDMSWCDPCVANPLSQEELRQAGVFWLNDEQVESGAMPSRGRRPAIAPAMAPVPQAQPVMLTRLHVRYTKETFPEDLMFVQTGDRNNFQTRYVIRNPWKGSATECSEAKHYVQTLLQRQEREAQTLANLTGWDINEVRKKANLSVRTTTDAVHWWSRLWK